MELTLEQATKMIEERFVEYPILGAVGRSMMFETNLSQILDFENVDHKHLLMIAYEVRVVLALYAPLSELAQNIAESTKLPIEKSSSLVTLIINTILDPVRNELEGYDAVWKKESAVASPDTSASAGMDPAKPLTRDELMQALERKRAAGSNIEVMRQKLEQATNQKIVGYDAAQSNDQNNLGA